MTRRILELALENLVAQRTAIEAEIAEIRAELEGFTSSAQSIPRSSPSRGRRRSRTAAERKAQSERMKAYWAKRKSEARKAKAAK